MKYSGIKTVLKSFKEFDSVCCYQKLTKCLWIFSSELGIKEARRYCIPLHDVMKWRLWYSYYYIKKRHCHAASSQKQMEISHRSGKNIFPCTLSCRKKVFHDFSKFPDIPLSFNFNNKPSCQTLSKAFDMSRKTPLTSQPSSNDL